jgi:hypothetical protein
MKTLMTAFVTALFTLSSGVAIAAEPAKKETAAAAKPAASAPAKADAKAAAKPGEKAEPAKKKEKKGGC